MACTNHTNSSICIGKTNPSYCTSHNNVYGCTSHNNVYGCTSHNNVYGCTSHYNANTCVGQTNASGCYTNTNVSYCNSKGNPFYCNAQVNDSKDSSNIYRSPCITNMTVFTDVDLNNVKIKASHINELRAAITREHNRRKNLTDNLGPNTDPDNLDKPYTTGSSPVVACPNNTLLDFGTTLNSNNEITAQHIADLRTNVRNFRLVSLPNNPTSESLVTEDLILSIRDRLNDFERECLCNCNYCTCQCNYCTCYCNYSCTCVCNYCTCHCNYACTCNCNYSCTCHCNYACTCNCNYACTCNCNYLCTCQCHYSCTCQCNYTCTCDCNYCTCNCNYQANYSVKGSVTLEYFDDIDYIYTAYFDVISGSVNSIRWECTYGSSFDNPYTQPTIFRHTDHSVSIFKLFASITCIINDTMPFYFDYYHDTYKHLLT